jgi:hypothetical protein
VLSIWIYVCGCENVALSMKICVVNVKNVCDCEIWMSVFVVMDVCDCEIWIFVAMKMYVVRINKT